MLTIPGKIPIIIYPLFWLLIGMIGWINTNNLADTAVWAVVIFISVLVHEYGHALTAVYFGNQAEISLVGLGGQTSRSGPPLSKGKEFLVVLNGPLMGFLLFFVCFYVKESGLLDTSPVLYEAASVGTAVNLFWTVLNLLPVWPMDGGQLLRIVLEALFGVRGFKIALWVSMLLAGLLAINFFMIQQMLIGAVFVMLGFEAYRAWSSIRNFSGHDVNNEFREALAKGNVLVERGEFDEALPILWLLRDRTKKGEIYQQATEQLAIILVHKEKFHQAYELLKPIKSRLSTEKLLFLQQLAYRLKQWQDVIEIGNEALADTTDSSVSLLNAYASSALGDVEGTIGWLKNAKQAGLTGLAQVIKNREFDSVRESPRFSQWANQQNLI